MQSGPSACAGLQRDGRDLVCSDGQVEDLSAYASLMKNLRAVWYFCGGNDPCAAVAAAAAAAAVGYGAERLQRRRPAATRRRRSRAARRLRARGPGLQLPADRHRSGRRHADVLRDEPAGLGHVQRSRPAHLRHADGRRRRRRTAASRSRCRMARLTRFAGRVRDHGDGRRRAAARRCRGRRRPRTRTAAR